MSKMPSQQLLLSWKDHNGALVSVFENLLKKNTLVDCTLAAEGQYLKAHKVVLSACSSYFELLLSQESEKHPIIILKDVKFQELEAAVNFMYRGEVEVYEDRLEAFLDVADSLQIKGLGSDENWQDCNERDSSGESSSAKPFLTRRQQSRKEDSNPRSDFSGKSSNVPSGCESIRNDESSSDHQSSPRGSSPPHTVSNCGVGSSSCTVRKDTHRNSDSHENIQQSSALPSFICAESDQCEENPIVKTETESDSFVEDQSNDAEQDLGDDVTMMDDEDDWDEPNNKTMDVVPTSQQNTDSVWIESGDQQNFSSVFVKEEPGTSASWNQEAVAHCVTASDDEAGPSAGTSSASAGVDCLLDEDIEQPTSASVQHNLPVAGCSRSSISENSTEVSLERTSPGPSSSKVNRPVSKEMFVRMMDLKRHVRSQSSGALSSVSQGKLPPGAPSIAQALKFIKEYGSRSSKRRTYKCSDCNYVTNWQSQLKRHLMTHTGEKPFKCPHCDYASGRKADLVNHVIIHTGEKPFKCPYCEYASCRKECLIKHFRTHTGDKPFKCSQCDYAASDKGNFARHLRKHTGEKPYKCPHCDYASGQKSTLAMHLRTHTGDKPYKCPQCDYASCRKGDLDKHLRKHTA